MSKQTSTLPTRALGTTGMAITRVGFGAWAIGGGGWSFAWGSQDDEASIAAMRHAVERGVNWIDTAAVYGLGHSEELVGRAASRLSRRRSAVRLHQVRPGVERAGSPWRRSLRIGEPASLRREVEQSLTRLGVEQIDLYQMHWPAEDGTPIEVYWQTLLDLKTEGKVRAVGLSNHKVDRLEAAERLGHVDTLQPPFSPIRRDALAAELPWCRRARHRRHRLQPDAVGTADRVVHRSARGGARRKTTGARGRRSSSRPRLQNNLALADALRPIAARHGTTVGAIAVAWTLAAPGVTGAIVGARSPEQVDGWIDAGSIDLTQRRPGRDRRRHRTHRRGNGTDDWQSESAVGSVTSQRVSAESSRGLETQSSLVR